MEDHFGQFLLSFSIKQDTQIRFQSRSLMDYVDGRIYHVYFVIGHYHIDEESRIEIYDPPSFPLLENAHLVSIYLHFICANLSF